MRFVANFLTYVWQKLFNNSQKQFTMSTFCFDNNKLKPSKSFYNEYLEM